MAMRRSFAVIMTAIVLLLALVPLSAFAASPAVRKMVLNRDSVSLKIGETFKLRVDIAPFNADRTVTWASSDESVATVADGIVTGVSIGKAEITVTSVSNPAVFVTASVLVAKPVESITLEDKSISLPRGETWEQIAYVLPEDATMQRPVWTTSDRKHNHYN